MEKIVLDTHCWLSFFYRNRFEKIAQAIVDNNIFTYTCNEQIKEFRDILNKYEKVKKMLPLNENIYIEAINNLCVSFEPQKRYALLPDYKDNYLIDLAHQTKSILVTNDKHFNITKKLKSPHIITISLQQFYVEMGL
jgi:putative PIN family toxin of toxin-antitoxin system